MTLVDESGRRVQLGERVGPRGGEGELFRVAGEPAAVAKIYHALPDAAKIEKLRRLRSLSAPGLQKVAAWPTQLLFQESAGKVAGFVMPFQPGRRVEQLYSPRDRLREYPKAGWDFLVHVARNCAAAFETLHEHGVVMADVNEGNVIVTDQGLARLIDCDSYQIAGADGRMLTCDVGVALWTPPELQGRPLSGVVRTADHDRFGLALLIFHLLFMGRHPYAGVPLLPDKDDGQLESAIARYRYAFGANHLQLGVRPPSHLLTPATLPGKVSQLFERAFLPTAAGAGGSRRPSGREWVEALAPTALPLRRCTSNPLHSFPDSAGDCPWCRIYLGGGPQFFAVQLVDDRATEAQVEALWKLIASRQAVRMRIHDFSGIRRPAARPIALPAGAVRVRPEFYVGWGFVVLAVILLFAVPSLALISVIIAVLGIVMARGGKSSPVYRQEVQRRKNAAENASNNLSRAQRSILQVHEEHSRLFAARFAALEAANERRRKLAADRQAAIRKLEGDKYGVQLRLFLDQHTIAAAKISNIGPNRKAVLKAYGVETALDVTPVLQVPGIGPANHHALLAWRQTIEQRFVFDANTALPKAELDQLEQRFRDARLKIEAELRAGPLELDRLTAQAQEALNRLEAAIPALLAAHDQAQADASLV